MSEEQEEGKVNLRIFPQMAEGAEPEEVKEKLSATLKVDRAKVDGWFESDEPTVLLKSVAKNVAQRYMDAIIQCGGSAELESLGGGDSSLSLEPIASSETTFFVCPKCQYEEEMPAGSTHEQCPKCGLVVSEWEAQKKEEAAKERALRKQLREKQKTGAGEESPKSQESPGSSENQVDADVQDSEEVQDGEEDKHAELERLKKQQLDLMKDLGMKRPGRFWKIFEKYPLPISGALGAVLVALTVFVVDQVGRYQASQADTAQRSAPVSEEAQLIAPAIAAAVQLQQNGNQQLVSELASTTVLMHGTGVSTHEEIVSSAQQMMKGVNPENFIAVASRSARPGAMTKPGPEGQEAVRINMGTLGGIRGIAGIEEFDTDVIESMAPPLLAHGHEQVLATLARKVQAPDPLDPTVMTTVDVIEDMDGSMIVDLMKELSRDQEWDRFLALNVDEFLDFGLMDQASALIDRMGNRVTRVESLGNYMITLLEGDPDMSLKAEMSRVYSEINAIEDADSRAAALLSVGLRLGDAGYGGEPAESMSRVRSMIQQARSSSDKSRISSRLALAHLDQGETGPALALLQSAMTHASQESDQSDRIAAFARVAQRYYDARNATLATEILSEAQILAATRLEPEDRSRAFGEIAIAQGYMGDMAGALISIENAATGVAEQQLLVKLAEFMIGLERYFEAQSVMARLTDSIGFNRLDIRLITALHYAGEEEQVRLRLESAFFNANRIDEPTERGIVLSQFGRLARRAGLNDRAELLFEAARMQSDVLEGRKRSLNMGLLGLEQSRALMPYSSQETMFSVEEAIVKDPISTEILATERIVENLMPAAVKALVEPEPEY